MAPSGPLLRCAVVTVSDELTLDEAEPGGWLRDAILAAGHDVAHHAVVTEEVTAVRTAVQTMAHGGRVDLVLTVGSIGVTARDVVVRAVAPLLDVPMPGFGELLRALSYAEVGSEAMLTRALAGRAARSFVFCLPGSRAAVELAWSRLILPQLDRMATMALR